jgi:hypothetical protein
VRGIHARRMVYGAVTESALSVEWLITPAAKGINARRII